MAPESDLQRQLEQELSNPPSQETAALSVIHRWLGFENFAPFFLFGGFFVPIGLLKMLLMISMVVVGPVVLWNLIRARWYGWFAVLSCSTAIPWIFGRFISGESYLLAILLQAGPLIGFFLTTWVLRLVAGEHLDEVRAMNVFRQKG